MASLVFKGHETRGKELHKLLENLGGVDAGYMGCNCVTCYYYINREGYIEGSNSIPSYMNNRVIMSLEEFEQKYPYKVWDKVRIPDYESEIRISSMHWDGYNVQYEVVTDEVEWYSTEELNDFNNAKNNKEEIMGDKATLVEIDLTKELKVADEVEVILGDYEFVLKDGRTYFVKKKPKYPKTYEECCRVIRHTTIDEVRGYKAYIIEAFQQLLVCRDAYWKIAGDWKPNFNDNEGKFVIAYCYGKVYTTMTTNYNRILVFPTEEMRDAFYENFNELIEECKELL